MNLRELQTGRSAVIKSVGGSGSLRRHFLDMGVIPGAELTLAKYAPMGDPMEISIHGYELTLRLKDAEGIEVEPIEKRHSEHKRIEIIEDTEHPGIGEPGKFHKPGDGEKLPDGTTLTYALVGNQNCGKTTLFNQLTGSNQHVGNFPGVTVDRKDGVIKNHPNTLVTACRVFIPCLPSARRRLYPEILCWTKNQRLSLTYWMRHASKEICISLCSCSRWACPWCLRLI